MRSEKNIEKLIRNLDLDVGTNDDIDGKILNELLERQKRSRRRDSAATRLNTWGIIFRSRAIKLAVAAVIVMVVLFGVKALTDGLVHKKEVLEGGVLVSDVNDGTGGYEDGNTPLLNVATTNNPSNTNEISPMRSVLASSSELLDKIIYTPASVLNTLEWKRRGGMISYSDSLRGVDAFLGRPDAAQMLLEKYKSDSHRLGELAEDANSIFHFIVMEDLLSSDEIMEQVRYSDMQKEVLGVIVESLSLRREYDSQQVKPFYGRSTVAQSAFAIARYLEALGSAEYKQWYTSMGRAKRGLFVSSGVTDEENADLIEIARNHLEKLDVVIRIYPDWMADGNNYETVKVAVDRDAIRWSDVKADGDSFVVFRGDEQVDEVVRLAVGDMMFIRRGDEKADFSLLPGSAAERVVEAQLVSGDGAALGVARVEAYLSHDGIYHGYHRPQLFFGEVKLDPSGLFKLPEVRGLDFDWELVVFHPHFGVAIVDVQRLDKRNVVRTPFVKIGSDADAFSIWGTVVDSDGKPVAGAVIESNRLYTAGGGALIPEGSCRVVSDDAGNFAMYSLLKDGRDIPIGSSYGITVNGPKGSGLVRHSGKIVIGSESRVVLQRRTLKFRRFVFESNGSEITDVEVLKKIRVDIWDDLGKDRYYYGDWKDGGYFPAGVYRVGNNRRFSDVLVTADSNEQIVFRESEGNQKTYWGSVVNAVTGEPMAGIIVCAGYIYERPLKITAEQWQAIRAIEGRLSGDEEAIGPLKGSFNRFCKATRTDDEGWYDLDYDSLKDTHFTMIFACEENYYAKGIHRLDVKVDSDGYGEVEPIVLFPYGKVLFEPNVVEPGRGLEIDVKVKVDSQSVLWAHEARGFSLPDEFTANKKASMLVPAGVKMRIEFCPQDHHAGANQPLSRKVFADIQLQQGEVLDLGCFGFEETIPVFVQLIDPAGMGVGDVTVRNKYDTNSRHFNSLADANGLASFRVSPRCKGKFDVRHEVSRNNFVRAELAYEVSGVEDANKVFEFELSEDLVKRLLRED